MRFDKVLSALFQHQAQEWSEEEELRTENVEFPRWALI